MTDAAPPALDGAAPDVAVGRDPADPARLVEALLFASADPLTDQDLRARLPESADLAAVMARLQADYDGRGIVLMRVAGGWAFRTAPDLADRLRLDVAQPRKLSRAALETLAIIAYHQPATRPEVEAIRGVSTSKGTLDTLIEAGWIRPGRRRQSPGRPLTWVTTPAFLDHFGLHSLEDLPGVEEMKAAGLLDARPLITKLPGGSADAHDDDGLDLPTVPTNDPLPADDAAEPDRDGG